jgi:tetratricopeptide (TPR) repeat protein
MRFAHPDWLLPVAGLWLLAALAVAFARRRAAGRRRRLLGAGAGAPSPRGDLLRLAAALAIAIALAGPQWGERSVRVPASGIDLVVLIDVSRSMEARDVPPSRLERARQAAREVLAGLAPGDRAALAAYAGRGVLLTPLTPDKQALIDMLPSLDPELMSAQGSRLGAGVRAALAAYPSGSPRPRLLLVLSDGEAPHGTPPDGSEEAAAAAVRVVTAAFGREDGAAIPDARGGLRDSEGNPVVTRRDVARLGALAAATGGAAFVADRWGALDSASVVAALRRDATAAPDGFVERRVAVTRATPFALLALVCLLAEAIPRPRLGSRRSARLATPGALLLAVALLLGADPGDGEELDARALLALGVRRAEAGDLAGAEHAFFAAAVRAHERGEAADAHYDLGVAALGRSDYARARDAFFDAIALAPDDRQAQFNLEWTLRRLAADARRDDERPPTASEEATEPDEAGERPADAAAEAGSEADAASQAAEAAEREAARRPAPLPPLDAEEAERWLGAVQDDPGRALRSALRGGRESRRPSRSGPAW